MFIEYVQSRPHHVALVDLLDYPDRNYIRSFATSQQLIDWIKRNCADEVRFIVIRRGNLGEQLPESQFARDDTLHHGDIQVGKAFVLNSYGVRYPGLGQGTG
jgi:hypothetical protein